MSILFSLPSKTLRLSPCSRQHHKIQCFHLHTFKQFFRIITNPCSSMLDLLNLHYLCVHFAFLNSWTTCFLVQFYRLYHCQQAVHEVFLILYHKLLLWADIHYEWIWEYFWSSLSKLTSSWHGLQSENKAVALLSHNLPRKQAQIISFSHWASLAMQNSKNIFWCSLVWLEEQTCLVWN